MAKATVPTNFVEKFLLSFGLREKKHGKVLLRDLPHSCVSISGSKPSRGSSLLARWASVVDHVGPLGSSKRFWPVSIPYTRQPRLQNSVSSGR
jgi:hypothetical protein